MNTPTAALAWEFWRRHRQRLIIMAGTLLGFIFVYPSLCAVAGFNPDSQNATNDFARLMAADLEHPMPLRFIQVLYLMFLIGGPVTAMFMTLLFTVWMFTLTEMDPKTRNPLTFPVRLFTLPVSTPFLFWRATIGGMVVVIGLVEAWNHGVHMPQIENFSDYQSCFIWITLLVLAQATTWTLAAWPITRMFVLLGLLMLLLAVPSQHSLRPESLLALTLAPFFLAGALLARISLQKMRQGEWQGRIWFHWKSRLVQWLTRAELRGPKRFSSPAQAQLWFEWRRSADRIWMVISAMVLLLLAFLGLRAALGYDPLDKDDLTGITVTLFAAPLVIFGLQSISPIRSDLPFMFTRPLTCGAIVTSMLKSTAISVVLSWVVVLAATSALPYLGNYHAVVQRVSSFPGREAALVIGLIFLTWRFAVINLSFVLTENQQMSQAPAWIVILMGVAGLAIFIITQNGVSFDWFWNHLAAWAAALVAVKFVCAFRVYRAALKRGLLSRTAVTNYLIVWCLLVGALLATLLLLAKPEQAVIVPACLGVVLLVPLVRTGVAPFALAWVRHISGGPTYRWADIRLRPPAV